MYWCFKLIVVTPFEHWGPSNNVLPVLVLNQKLWMLICVQRFGNKRVGKKHCILASQWYFYLFIRTEQCSKYQWLVHCADYLSRCTCMLYSPYPEWQLYIRIVFKQLQCCFVCAHILLLLLFLCNTELIYNWCTIKKLLSYYKNPCISVVFNRSISKL